VCRSPYTFELATLKDLRQAAQQIQEQMAATVSVGQYTMSRLEERSDCVFPRCIVMLKVWAVS